MKLIHLLVIVIFVFTQSPSTAQTDCKVFVRGISETYFGKCKKGLAHGKGVAKGVDAYEGFFKNGFPHGKGVYYWANGDYYEGEWKEGNRDGEGLFVYYEDGEKRMMDGIWKDDEYKGAKPVKPKVLNSVSIFRHEFQKLSDEGNNVVVDIYLGGTNNTDLEQFTFWGSNGTRYQTGASVGFENIVYPFEGKVSYYTWNQTHTSRYYANFEFRIEEPGRWQVRIYNK